MQLFSAAILLALASCTSLVNAHSWLINPFARDGPGSSANVGTDAGGNRAPPCGWKTKKQANPSKLIFKRGQTIPIKWPRNNHPGGFIRLALVPFLSSQEWKDFDKNVVQYNCHETDCKGNWGDPLGGDGPKFKDGENVCTIGWKVPSWVKDGKYTLQWLWHGGGSYYGNKFAGQADWYGCSDFTIKGSVSRLSTIAKRPKCPVYKPGDVHTRKTNNSKKCLYFNLGNQPNKCSPDGCVGQYKYGVPIQLVKAGCIDINGNSI